MVSSAQPECRNRRERERERGREEGGREGERLRIALILVLPQNKTASSLVIVVVLPGCVSNSSPANSVYRGTLNLLA